MRNAYVGIPRDTSKSTCALKYLPLQNNVTPCIYQMLSITEIRTLAQKITQTTKLIFSSLLTLLVGKEFICTISRFYQYFIRWP